jgi:AcrR family transcriptional regulator
MTGKHHSARQPKGGRPVDRRSQRTRRSLHEALMRLMSERGYDAISIGDIADAANVGRSTFYAHFTGKDDLLREGMGYLRDLLQTKHASCASQLDHPDERMLAFSQFMTAHLYEQRRLHRALMRSRAGQIVMDRVRDILLDLLRSEFESRKAKSGRQTVPSEIAARFVIGAYLSVVTWWLDHGARQSPEEINKAFRTLALTGLAALSRPDAVLFAGLK